MTKPDYSALDAAILKTLAVGPTPFGYLINRHHTLANSLAKPTDRGSPGGWRVIDRRLQALRKAGKITHDRKTGWRLA